MTTPLDQAFAAMEATPEDEGARRTFLRRLAASELHVLLESEPEGDDIAPDLYAVEEGRFALVFDTADRLADFVGRPAPTAVLPGRVLAQMFAGHEIGLALNPGVAPSAHLIPAEAVEWLAELSAAAPDRAEARPVSFAAPDALPDGLFDLVDEVLASAPGLARTAWLARAVWADGAQGLVLAVIDPVPGAEPALSRALAEALAFAGLGQGWLDVVFLNGQDPAARAIAAQGLGFVLPGQTGAQAAAPSAPPGSDPDRPPRLR
jgi:hypothetical protein